MIHMFSFKSSHTNIMLSTYMSYFHDRLNTSFRARRLRIKWAPLSKIDSCYSVSDLHETFYRCSTSGGIYIKKCSLLYLYHSGDFQEPRLKTELSCYKCLFSTLQATCLGLNSSERRLLVALDERKSFSNFYFVSFQCSQNFHVLKI